MKHSSIIRRIYLYLFALVGLALLIIGTVRFIDMGLKAFIFTKAEEEEKFRSVMPLEPYQMKFEQYRESEELTVEEKQLIKNWLEEYKRSQEQPKVDYVVKRRHENASINLAMIIVGLPLYFYHWRIIREETG